MNALRSLALTLVLCSTSAVALAQPSEPDRARAHALAIEGHDALEKGDYATAEDRYAKAEALVHAPTLLLGLAQAHVGRKLLVKALDEYRRIVKEGAAPGSPKPWFAAVETAKKELAALEPRVPSVVIRVEGPAAPKVSIDGAELPASSLGSPYAVDPGTHRVEATAAGFRAGSQSFTIAERQAQNVSLTLTADEPKAGPIAVPSAAPSAAPRGAPPASEPHRDAPEPDHGSGFPMKTVGFIVLGVGIVGVVAGGVTGGLAVREHSILNKNCPDGDCPRDRKDTLDTFHTLATISTIGFIAGGVCLAGGITLLVLAPSGSAAKTGGTPRRESVAQADITPFVGLGSLGARGRF